MRFTRCFWRHLFLFFKDHVLLIFFFLVAPIGITVVRLLFLNDEFIDAIYYLFLSFFILVCFLLYKLYVTWNLYEVICMAHTAQINVDKVDDFFIWSPRGSEEQHYQDIVERIHRIYMTENIKNEDMRHESKLMIYRWVHQLKTPLSVVKLIAEKKDINNNDMKVVMQSVNQMQYDLDQILNMYKLDALKNDFHVEEINLHDLSKLCVNELKSWFIMNEIFPKLEVDCDLVVVSDIKWLKFILYQLLTNAIKYSDAGKRILIQSYLLSDKVILAIEDEGCGIDEGDINSIFDLFFTGQNGRLRGESSGMGLYMVKQILEYLGHEIKVESKLNEGSRFSVEFKAFRK